MGNDDGEKGRDSVALAAERNKLTAQIQRCDAGSVEGLMLKKQKLHLELQLAEMCETQNAKEVQDEALESGMVLHVKQPTVVAGKECPICYSPFQSHVENWDDKQSFMFYACCGNFICSSCIKKNYEVNGRNAQTSLQACPFCRELGIWPMQNSKHLPAFAERGNTHAQFLLAGQLESTGDEKQAIQWYQRASKEGSLRADQSLGSYYSAGAPEIGLSQ